MQDIVEDQIAGSADRDHGDLLADEVFGRLDGRIVLDHEQRLPLRSAVCLAQRPQGEASIGGKKERCPGYAARIEIAADDARDRVRAHHSWRYVETFSLEESLLQGQVDHAVIRDGKDAESDIGFFNFASLCGRRLSARHEAKRNEDARHQTCIEASTATPWPMSPQ